LTSPVTCLCTDSASRGCKDNRNCSAVSITSGKYKPLFTRFHGYREDSLSCKGVTIRLCFFSLFISHFFLALFVSALLLLSIYLFLQLFFPFILCFSLSFHPVSFSLSLSLSFFVSLLIFSFKFSFFCSSFLSHIFIFLPFSLV
jgi:hypothetical protein